MESLFNKAAGLQLYQKETPTQVFSCEFWETFKNTCSEEHPWETACDEMGGWGLSAAWSVYCFKACYTLQCWTDYQQLKMIIIIFCDFLMFFHFFPSPQMKRSAIISNKNVYTSYLTSFPTTFRKISELARIITSAQSSCQNKNLFVTNQNFLKNRNLTFPVRHCFTWKLEFVSNILSEIISGNIFLLLIHPRPLPTWLLWKFW